MCVLQNMDFLCINYILKVFGNTLFGEPTHGCMNFTNGHAIVGKILIVERGMCSFNRKVCKAFCCFRQKWVQMSHAMANTWITGSCMLRLWLKLPAISDAACARSWKLKVQRIAIMGFSLGIPSNIPKSILNTLCHVVFQIGTMFWDYNAQKVLIT